MPVVTSASGYAHRGLDKLEENLPILQQPPEKVMDFRQGSLKEQGPTWVLGLWSTSTRRDKCDSLFPDLPKHAPAPQLYSPLGSWTNILKASQICSKPPPVSHLAQRKAKALPTLT